MFEQAFKNLDDTLRREAGCTTELDYTEQSSWLLFLKYLDDLEEDGKIDHNVALTGDDLRDFVNDRLFPYLQKFKQSAESADTIEYKIGEIFGEIKNKFQSGYNLRDALD
ncbi:type I restriction-modification system subunit M N-terminal domain-containing protein [Crocosphaera sp. XPORK-15E]|uniref:type I restriction-modification system subunit M N-terminal domain-containing protein n=1 Tax=Crocosphaera sp. XPORK-15E TaxID=3110247 RepID=UPI002B20ABB5|nr:type I restriction-modification system subunit M N-terminal domain-containing protein [Crocosphaera sp. XPORK-15E]MEA5535269.1 type I restriction-modification system subunit M N-terminal domain-containing protein [Crocosphaera sp. XPORK-15E]